MNTKSISLTLIAGLFAFTACKKELEPQESSAESEKTTDSSAVVANTPVPMPSQTGTAAPAQIQQQPAAVTQAQPQKVAKGMNPAHGQPGHRCDIPVGASLSSPPGKTPAAPVQNTATRITPTQTNGTVTQTQPAQGPPAILNPAASTTTTTAPGMNPPHGQAGHRCDVAVGAALPKS